MNIHLQIDVPPERAEQFEQELSDTLRRAVETNLETRDERDEARHQRDCILFAATHLDAVIDEAIRLFGGDDGVFNAAGFSSAAARLSGTGALLDGRRVHQLVAATCHTLVGGAHYIRRGRR